MNRRTLIEVSCGVLALVVLALVIRNWADDKAALATAKESASAANKIIATQNAAIKSLDKEISDRDAKAQTEVKKYEPLRHVKTAKQAAEALPMLVNLPAQPKEVTLADTPSAVAKPGDYVWTPEAMIANTQRLAECKQNSILLEACQANTKDLRGEINAEHLKFLAQVEVTTKYKDAAKGGSKAHRIFKVLKPVGCAAAGAAAGSLSNNKPVGAALGAGAGGIFCALF